MSSEISLRALTATDGGELSAWFSNEREVVQWAGSELHYPIDECQIEALLSQGRTTPPQRLCWMAEASGVPVGHVQLSFDWRNGNAVLSRVAVSPKFRGQGFSRPMLTGVLRMAFSNPEIERVELNVFVWNARAIAAYERLGFVHEGVRRSSVSVDGERWDTAIMSFLRNEWEMR